MAPDGAGSALRGVRVVQCLPLPRFIAGEVMIGKLIVFLLLCCPVFAGDRGMCVRGYQVVGQSTNHMTVTRIADFEDGQSAWLTAGHCVEIGLPVMLIDGAGDVHEAEVVADSKNPDVALIRGPSFVEKRHFRLVDRAPRKAAIYSFVVKRKKSYEVAIEDAGELFGSAKAEQGESGAPAYDADECYGLLIGNTEDVRECSLDLYGRQVCRVRPGRVTFERSRTIIRWLETTSYQPCVPNAGNPIHPIPQPEPQPRPVGRADCDCDRQFAALRLRVEQLETRKLVAGPVGPRGEVGPQGPAGRAGTVTVVLKHNEKQLERLPNLSSGSTVEVPIRRTETTSTGSN